MCMPFKGRSCRFSILYMLLRIGAGAKDHLEWCEQRPQTPRMEGTLGPALKKLPFSCADH